MFQRRIANIVSAAAVVLISPLLAVEVTEPAGPTHGYPGFVNINGKKLADGEFRQWMRASQSRPA